MKREKLRSLSIIFVLLLSGCQKTQPETLRAPIRFVDTQYQTIWITNEIARFIIEHGYEYPVETIIMTVAESQSAIVVGQVDAILEFWPTGDMEWYQQSQASKQIVDIGPIYERSQQGWYIPRYMIEGNLLLNIEPAAPDLKSVFDLNQYAALFSPEGNSAKGIILNCIDAWHCSKVNEYKLYAYGLENNYELLTPTSSAELDELIVTAYQDGKPVLAYYWEPTGLLGALDMVKLDEPSYNEACWSQLNFAIENNIPPEEIDAFSACAYETRSVRKLISPEFQDYAPQVVQMLAKMNVTTDGINQAAAFMTKENASSREAAIWYLINYKSLWKTWMPETVFNKIDQALYFID
jgi:glycine betaine/proline transport system substrate-binding protein